MVGSGSRDFLIIYNDLRAVFIGAGHSKGFILLLMLYKCIRKERFKCRDKTEKEGLRGFPWDDHIGQKMAKMAKIHFLKGISGIGRGNDEDFGKVVKIYADIYNKGGKNY